MKKIFWAAVLLGGPLLVGTTITAQEKNSESAVPQMQGMGPSMGMGMMGHGGKTGQIRQTMEMMPMMQGMMHIMDACNRMMGRASSSSQPSNKQFAAPLGVLYPEDYVDKIRGEGMLCPSF